MKMTVLYYSKTGNTKHMAEIIAQGMEQAEGAEAKAFPLDGIDAAWAAESKCIVLGSPIYMASICAEVHAFLQGPIMKYGLPGKLGGAFATADYIHGGGELGIRQILDCMMVGGMLTYSGGGACGKPVIHLGPVAIGGNLDAFTDTFLTYGRRMAEKALEIYR